MTHESSMPDQAVTIRPGRTEDGPAEAALHRAEGWCYDDAAILAEYHDDAYEPSSVLVAEVDGEVVGKVELFVAYRSSHGRFGLIRRFVVRPDQRGRGVGRALLDAATERARALGCALVELSVDVTNPEAHAYYRRAGFTEDRVEVVMVKQLGG